MNIAEALEAIVEGFKSLAEIMGNIVGSILDSISPLTTRNVYDYSTKGYGKAAGLPERETTFLELAYPSVG